MELTDSLAVSVSALDAHRHRLNVIASNLANAQSTKTSTGGPYRRRDVVFQAAPVSPTFQKAFKQGDVRPRPSSLGRSQSRPRHRRQEARTDGVRTLVIPMRTKRDS
jgi:flagellar basal body rod protein FlgC